MGWWLEPTTNPLTQSAEFPSDVVADNIPITPDGYFGSIIPIGWLKTMVEAGFRNILLYNKTYPAPTATPDTKWDVAALGQVCVRGIRPTTKSDNTALESGSIINGGLSIRNAVGWVFESLGVDCGPTYAALNASDATAYPMAASGGGIVFTDGGRNRIEDVELIMPENGGTEHGILINSSPYTMIRGIKATYGAHGVAVKSQFVTVEDLEAHLTPYGLTIKSDTVAAGTGYQAKNVQVRGVSTFDCLHSVAIISGGTRVANASIEAIQVSGVRHQQTAYTQGNASSCIEVNDQATNDEFYAIHVEDVVATRCDYAIRVSCSLPVGVSFGTVVHDTGFVSLRGAVSASTASPLSVGSLVANSVQYLWQVSAYGIFIVDHIAAKNVSNAALFGTSDNSLVYLGGHKIADANQRTVAGNAQTYSNSCTDYAGNTNQLRLDVFGYGSTMIGETAPGSQSAQTNYDVLTLPRYCRPAAKQLISALAYVSGGTVTPIAATVTTAGLVTVLSLPANTTYIAFNSRWKI